MVKLAKALKMGKYGHGVFLLSVPFPVASLMIVIDLIFQLCKL